MELGEGDVVLARGPEASIIRASMLGSLTLVGYRVQLAQMQGILTRTELLQLQQLAEGGKLGSRHYDHQLEIPRLFGELCEMQGECADLVLRARMLEILCLAAAEDLAEPRPPIPRTPSVRARFEKLIGELPEKELELQSPHLLARRCGCSERHLSRLFSEFFGRSFRSKQTELRLARAKHLLQESDTKIVDVAKASGYHHRGLFNTIFKQHFGMTPAQWRQKHRKAQARRPSTLVT